MKVSDALTQRRSVRAYQDKTVPEALMQEIFTQAQHAPSNCNTQPWHVSVVSGEARDALEQALLADIMSGKPPSPTFQPGDKDLSEVYKKRQVDCAIALYDAMDIKYEEKEKRQQLMLRNWQFFGAPHAAFFSMPKSMGEVNAVDIGIYLQTIMLLMTEHGIACCPQGALAFYPDPVHELAQIPEGNGILFGLSFGYAEEGAAINSFQMDREALTTSVTFLS
ncbi:MAG: nitroreductase [Pseudomonadota bacterium]